MTLVPVAGWFNLAPRAAGIVPLYGAPEVKRKLRDHRTFFLPCLSWVHPFVRPQATHPFVPTCRRQSAARRKLSRMPLLRHRLRRREASWTASSTALAWRQVGTALRAICDPVFGKVRASTWFDA